MQKENRILICGGAGYVGGAVTDLLKGLNIDFIVYDNLTFERDYRKKVRFMYGDIRDTNKLKAVINTYNPTAIIWLAAIVGDQACQVNPELTISVNQESVKWLANNYDGRIVFTSSCSVYGKNEETLTEKSKTNPLSLYARTKLKSEEYLKDKNAVIFRMGTLYGISDEFSRIRLDLVVNILSLKAIKREPLTVFGGEQWRPLLHVKDAGEAIAMAAIDWNKSNLKQGIYNIKRDNLTIKAIAEEIKATSSEMGNTVEIEYSDISFEDSRNYKVSSNKYNSTYGHRKFERTIRTGAIEIMELIKNGRIKDPLNNVYHNARYMEENKNDSDNSSRE